jgi:carboxyl-terminal processing protease
MLVLSTAAASLFAQGPTASVGNYRDDIFDISPNRSFSASRGASERRAVPVNDSHEVREVLSDLTEALEIIRHNYANGDRIDLNGVSKSAIQGALETLDPHSSYFDPTEYHEFLEEEDSVYSGIGATIAGYRNNGSLDTYVVSTLPGSPAAMARLAYGDRIIKVDNELFTNRSSDDVRDAVRGSAGTKLTLTVEKASTGRLERVDIRRRVVPQPSIKDSLILPGGVGYIAMTEGFNYTTANELSEALRKLRSRGIKGLVLDLRENPGGILEQSVRVAEKFLPAGATIVTQRGRTKIDNRVWRSENRNPDTLPLVLLVNEDSASASEILAGALQDNDRALIVGERTFGKGLVQSLYDTPYGSGLTLTTGRYYTPSGRSIQREYSGASIYDYYNHRSPVAARSVDPVKTSRNRSVYGGDGIEPDTTVRSNQLSAAQTELADQLFFFTREMVNGRGPVAFVPSKYVRTGTTSWVDSAVNTELVQNFENYARSSGRVSGETLANEKQFVIDRLKYDLTLALRGDTEANRIFLLTDEPVLTALAQFPKARELALASRTHP